MRVLGLDPGLRHTGWGLVEDIDVGYMAPAWGQITPDPKHSLASRLAFLFEHLKLCVENHKPNVIALEKTLIGRGQYDSLKLAFARGVCLAVAGTFKIPIYEYSPTHIKKAITGYGAASKDQISFMVKEQLSIKGDISPDESDALAIALSCIT